MAATASGGVVTGKPLIESDRVEGTAVYDRKGNKIGSVKRLISTRRPVRSPTPSCPSAASWALAARSIPFLGTSWTTTPALVASEPTSLKIRFGARRTSIVTAITTGRIGSGSGNSTTTGKHLTIGEYDDARGPFGPLLTRALMAPQSSLAAFRLRESCGVRPASASRTGGHEKGSIRDCAWARVPGLLLARSARGCGGRFAREPGGGGRAADQDARHFDSPAGQRPQLCGERDR